MGAPSTSLGDRVGGGVVSASNRSAAAPDPGPPQRRAARTPGRVSVMMIKLAGVLGAVTLAVCGCSAADSSAAGRAAQEFVTAVTGSGGASACALPAPRARDGLGPAGCGPGSPVGQVPHDTVTETVV
jgi:hypothetical protein